MLHSHIDVIFVKWTLTYDSLSKTTGGSLGEQHGYINIYIKIKILEIPTRLPTSRMGLGTSIPKRMNHQGNLLISTRSGDSELDEIDTNKRAYLSSWTEL